MSAPGERKSERRMHPEFRRDLAALLAERDELVKDHEADLERFVFEFDRATAAQKEVERLTALVARLEAKE